MIEGQLIFDGFSYGMGTAKTTSGEEKRVIVFQSPSTKATFNFTFTKDELQKFIQIISDSYIVPAHEMPRGHLIKL